MINYTSDETISFMNKIFFLLIFFGFQIVSAQSIESNTFQFMQNGEVFFVGIIYSIITTIGFILLLAILGTLAQKSTERVKKISGTSIKTIKLQSYELLTAERITAFFLWCIRSIKLILTLALIYFYVPLLLSFFPQTANLAPIILGYVTEPLGKILKTVLNFTPNFFFILVIVFVTKYVLGFVNFLFNEIDRGSLKFDGFYSDWAMPTYKLVRLLILAIALVMAFPYLPGSGSPAFQGVSVFIGVLLSFGSSSAISNMVAGIVITYMRPFKVGDRVKIADTMGDIIDKTLLVTRILTIKNVEITIPNSMVLNSHIINYSSSASTAGLILNTSVTIGYDAPWRQVHEALIKAAQKTNLICDKPAPFVLQTALNDFYVSYEINAYTNHAAKMATIYSELNQNIQDSFNEAGIEIMSPHYSSLRDGNATTIPQTYLAKDYKAPKFDVNVDNK